MGQAFLTGVTTAPSSLLDITVPARRGKSRLQLNTDRTAQLASNNYPLCVASGLTCGSSDQDDSSTSDLDSTGDTGTTLRKDLKKITYETIFQNIASYPNVADVTDPLLYTRTYDMGAGKQIVITTDMRTDNKVISKIIGDTGIPETIVKTITFYQDQPVITTYTLE